MVLNSLAEAISNLEAASDGAAMKTALIDLAETLNTLQGSDTQKLGGKGPQEYVLKSEIASIKRKFESWLQYEELPTNDPKKVQKVMRNKDITKYFGNILDSLKKVNGDVDGKTNKAPKAEIGDDIKSCLTILQTTFDEIESAVNEVSTGPDSHIDTDDSIEDFATKISNIKKNNLDVKPITVTEDGYTKESDIIRDEHGVIISGHAYNPVTVDIKLKGQDAVLTNTGNNTPDAGYDGFSSVTIQISDTGGSGSGGSGSGSGADGAVALKLTEDTITENGEYLAPDGYDGYAKVDVQVTEYDSPAEQEELTVTFVTSHSDGTTETLDTKHVLTGEDCVYDGPPPQYQNDGMFEEPYYFDRWSPRPVNVITNMTCNAIYGKATRDDNAYWIDDVTWCKSDWIDICKGRVQPVGTVKVLKLKDGSFLTLYCGAKNGSLTVWSSVEPIPLSGTPGPSADESYGSSQLHAYLNGDFITQILPDWLVPYLYTATLSHLAPIMDSSSSFNGVSGNKLLGSGTSEYDPQGHLVSTGVTYDGPDSIPVWGLAQEYVAARVWIPSAIELGLLDSYRGDFTNDIYTCNDWTYNGQPRPPFNTFKRLGRKTNVPFPALAQTGLIKKGSEPDSGTCEFQRYQLPKNSPNIKTIQDYYGPTTHPKSDYPISIYNEHWQVGPDKSGYRTGMAGLHNVLPLAPGRFSGGTGSILLRDRVISRCSITGEHWGEGWEQTDTTETGEEYVRWRGNSIVRDDPLTSARFTYTEMSTTGCYQSSTMSAGIHACFAIKPKTSLTPGGF